MTLNAKHIWHIIDPQYAVNEFTHPLPWTTEGFTALYGATLEASTERMRNGGPVLKVSGSGGWSHEVKGLVVGEWYSLGFDVFGYDPEPLEVNLDGTTYIDSLSTAQGRWRRVNIPFLASSTTHAIHVMWDGEGSFYTDRICVTKGKEPHTFFCGFGFSTPSSAEHFHWEGAPWASKSVHNGLERRCGVMVDLEQLFTVEQAIGFGMAPISLRRTDVLTDGAVPQGYTTESRDFSLIGKIKGKDRVELFQKRKKLSMLIRPDALDGQPLNLLHQFVDATTGEPLSEQVTIECRYKDGLRDAPKYATTADDVITFEAHLGYFYANSLDGYRLGEKVPLESNNVIMKRKTGEWVALPGLDGEVRCLAEDNAGRIWAGGDFTGKIAYSRGGAWQVPRTVYGKIDPNGSVRAIAVTPDNQVFFGGDFTTIFDGSTTTTVNRVAQLQPTTSINTWTLTALQGTGINNGSVHALLIDNMGKLVIGGTFSSANGSTSRGIARYDTVIDGGNPWKQYTGFKTGAQIYTLAHSGRANVVCLGGYFESTMGTIKNLGQLMLDTSTVMSFGSPTRMQGSVNKIAKRPDGSFVIAGAGVDFESSEYGFIHQGVGQIRGSSTSPLSNHQVVVEAKPGMYNAVIDEDGGVVLFSDANVLVNATNCGGYPYFKNGAWNRHPEISMITDSGTDVKVNDMLILRNGDIIYAGLWSGNIMVPPPTGVLHVETEATAGVYPIIRVFGSNRLHFIRSHKTGKVIFFKDAYIPHGSWLEMSLRRDKIQVYLDWKNALNIIGDGSDYADFTVEPELNLMHVHAQKLPDDPQDIPGDIFVLWQPRYWSLEGSIYGTV